MEIYTFKSSKNFKASYVNFLSLPNKTVTPLISIDTLSNKTTNTATQSKSTKIKFKNELLTTFQRLLIDFSTNLHSAAIFPSLSSKNCHSSNLMDKFCLINQQLQSFKTSQKELKVGLSFSKKFGFSCVNKSPLKLTNSALYLLLTLSCIMS